MPAANVGNRTSIEAPFYDMMPRNSQRKNVIWKWATRPPMASLAACELENLKMRRAESRLREELGRPDSIDGSWEQARVAAVGRTWAKPEI